MRLAYEMHVMRVDSHMRSSFTYFGPHSDAERMDIRKRNTRMFACGTYGYPHAECTRITCTGFGQEHAPRDVIENHLTVISLISDYISNQL